MYGVEKVTVPEQPAFVQIYAGSTFSTISSKTHIADTATAVMTADEFAITVVDGCDVTAEPEDSRQYSAAITAAALHTVQHGILVGKFTTPEQLQNYFFHLTQTIAKNWSFTDLGAAVTFSGSVIYFDPVAQKYKQFAYGLGDTALAFQGERLEEGRGATLHLQSNFRPSSDMAVMETQLPALGKKYSRVQAMHITAKVVDIPESAQSLQLMTDGGELYYHLEENGTATTPATGACTGLPGHGQLLTTEENILSTINPKNYQAAVNAADKEEFS